MSRFDDIVKQNSPGSLVQSPVFKDAPESMKTSVTSGDFNEVSASMHSVAGAAGALLAMIVVYPLDNLRTRLQVSRRESNLSVFAAMDEIIKKEGWKGLYTGLRSALLGVGVSWAVYYYFYALFQAYVSRRRSGSSNSALANLAVAMGAGMISAFATNPIWVVNTRQKLRQTGKTGDKQDSEKGFIATLKSIAAEEGVSGLFSGLKVSLILVANPAIQFACYEGLKQVLLARARRSALQARRSALKAEMSGVHIFRNSLAPADSAAGSANALVAAAMETRTHSSAIPAVSGRGAGAATASMGVPGVRLGPAEIFVIGAIAKLAATVVTYPYQVVKSRQQSRQPTAAPQGGVDASGRVSLTGVDGYGGSVDCIVKILEQEGVKGLFRGMQSKLLATALTSAVMFVGYEHILQAVVSASKAVKRN